MSSRDFIRRLHEKYGGAAGEPTPVLGPACALAPLDAFLADTSIPLAVFHSRTLKRDFVLARDSAALAALTEADGGLPVLTFAECEQLEGLRLAELGAILDAKRLLGPEVTLREVRRASALQ